MASKFTNRLIKESSPYLLQHAHNPVDWYPWGEEALQAARERDLPILVSIGYSACHWCHVMEHESFENEEVAAYMNDHFINIKIDREERPDLDHIYMDAVQAIAGSGGWPLNVFLTTETKPFYGGTYFPPKKMHNRPSWMDILNFITTAWTNRREEILQQANGLLDHIHSSGNKLLKDLSLKLSQEDISRDDCKLIATNILNKADTVNGGFGAAPKFPQTFTLQYLLMHGYFFKDESALNHALFSIRQLCNGGIYDHLAGGMSRYSTDNEWLAPHFEKMLYDNALLVNVLCDAYQVSKNDFFKEAIDKTLQFLILEMKHPGGGFYAALDADTEGVEGKFYVWNKKEIEEVLGNEADLCCKWYGVTEEGNWEEKNILHIHTAPEDFAEQNSIDPGVLKQKIGLWNKSLLERRNNRVKPAIDDKCLLGWNALLLTAFCKAAAALNRPEYRKEAISLFDFIITRYKKDDGSFYHTYKNGDATHPAFLDDYACLVQGCLHLQEVTSDQKYLQEAKDITVYLLANFLDEETGMFCFTHVAQKDILVRKTEIYDGAVPSGNSLMAENLLQLSILFGIREWGEKGIEMVQLLKEVVTKYPTSFGIWATIILKQFIGIPEIVVTGKEKDAVLAEVMGMYLPNKVLQSSNIPGDFPLLVGKDFSEKVLIYLCKQYACSLPVYTVNELKKQLFKTIS